MFGSKNKELLEDYEKLKEEFHACDEIVANLLNKKNDYQAAQGELEESRRQMDQCVSQIGSNMESAAEMAHANVEEGHKLLEGITASCRALDLSETRRSDLESEIEQMYQSCMGLVESNKHYTDLSKNMTEAVGQLRSQDEEHLNKLEEMNDLGKQMGVVALNAAIEAGRLGEAGKQFVAAAEDVRVLSGEYEALVEELKKEMKEHDEKLYDLEEEVKRLISLLKDSNVASTKLMKRSGQTKEASAKLADNTLTSDLNALKDQVTEICSSQEEVAKMQERNRMQLSDIEEEGKTQDNYISEMSGIIGPILAEVIGYKEKETE